MKLATMIQCIEVILKSAQQLGNSCGGTMAHVGSPWLGVGRVGEGEG